MEPTDKNNKKMIDGKVSPFSVTADGYVLMDGVWIDYMTARVRHPDGDWVYPVIMFNTHGADEVVVCPSCGNKIPNNRPVFLMSNGEHVFPCAEEDAWIWWTVPGRDVKTLQGEE